MYIFKEPVGIHIGNNCNLSCDECITLSNFNFKKWFKWDDFKDFYLRWSEKVNFQNIYIFGGEPYANPELINWAINLKKLWPESNFWILTNGTYIKQELELTKRLIDLGYAIQVSCKDEKYLEEVIFTIPELFDDFTTVNETKKTNPTMRPYTESNIIEYTINDKVVLQVYEDFNFLPSSIKEIKNKILYFHKNDPQITHNKCPIIPCNVLLNGLLYKCPLVSTFSEAKYQFQFEKSAYDLLEQYNAGNPYSSADDVINFLKNLENYIPQCSLCNYANIDLESSLIRLDPRKKKIKLQTIKDL